jgi:thiamine kinase-like enzyme
MTITIEEVVKQIDLWNNKTIEITHLSGGLTNTNFRVVVNGEPFFVRIPGESTDLLAVNRDNEYYNSQAAAKAGVGPQVYYHLPNHDVMVLEFIAGETMSNQRLNEPGMPARIAKSIKMLHSGPRFLTDFNMFRLTEFYLEICRKNHIRFPDGYLDRLPSVDSIEEALAVRPMATVPCNNDLLAENYIDDGKILRLIDFEYSGNNDPCFELGNTCQELGFDGPRIIELCSEYFGRNSPAMLSRMKLNMIMSDVGWTLWAAIQAKISKIDYDFWGWAVERWNRAVEKFDSPNFRRWLLDVREQT